MLMAVQHIPVLKQKLFLKQLLKRVRYGAAGLARDESLRICRGISTVRHETLSPRSEQAHYHSSRVL